MAGVLTIRVLYGEVERKLKAADLTKPLFESIGAAILTQVQLGFKFTQSPWGDQWAKPKYRAGQALTDTARLRRSIRSVADKEGVTVGTNLKYARIHQFGGTITAKNAPFLAIPKPGGGIFRKKSVFIPARPYLPITESGRPALPPKWRPLVVSRIKSFYAKALTEVA